jgi:hypothetical protein
MQVMVGLWEGSASLASIAKLDEIMPVIIFSFMGACFVQPSVTRQRFSRVVRVSFQRFALLWPTVRSFYIALELVCGLAALTASLVCLLACLLAVQTLACFLIRLCQQQVSCILQLVLPHCFVILLPLSD